MAKKQIEQTLRIVATKYKYEVVTDNVREVQIAQNKVSRYMDGLVRECTDRGYEIHECTEFRTILKSMNGDYFIELLNNLPNKV